MKVVPFSRPDDERDENALARKIEAALHGESGGEAAEYWRELRTEVRSLAPPMSPEFERELRERIEARAAAPKSPRVRRRVRTLPVRLRTWLGSGMHSRLIAVGGACVVAVVLVLAIATPWRTSESGSASSASSVRPDEFVPAEGLLKARKGQAKTRESSGATGAEAAGGDVATKVDNSQLTPFAKDLGSQTARVQQRAATLTLAPKPAEVQTVADRIAQLAARDGGFVQSSQVRLQHGTGGEANLQLSLPSARLSAALAELARLAPTRAQSQSLQDITDEYAAARTKLSDAVAARQALLRALAKATTQGEIESLHARLSLASAAITRTRTAFAAVSRRGSNSTVEVSVLGDAHAGSDRSTLSKALHDAGDVLKVALAVLIVSLAVLVPLALLGVLAALAWRTSRRRLRERALS